jgi:AraC-like DNA-binding protein
LRKTWFELREEAVRLAVRHDPVTNQHRTDGDAVEVLMLITGEKRFAEDGFDQRYVTFMIDEHTTLVYLEVHGHGLAQVPQNRHPDAYELDITPSGNAVIVIEGQEVQSSNEALVLIHPNARHSGRVEVDGLFQGYSLFLDRALVGEQVNTGFYSLVHDRQRRIQRLFLLISEELRADLAPPASPALPNDAFISDILAALVAELRRDVLAAHLPESFQRLLAFIRQHHAEKLTVDDLAKAALVSKYHLIRRFKGLTGTTPMHYLNDVRLQQAAVALRHDVQRGIAEVAYASGFNDLSAFNRNFKRHFGVSPTAYRRKLLHHDET